MHMSDPEPISESNQTVHTSQESDRGTLNFEGNSDFSCSEFEAVLPQVPQMIKNRKRAQSQAKQ
jgi:hypothetical protein